ncbi:hypothetical protein LJR246_005245 [Mesorhizobium sp. LjRoot246]
MHFSGSAQGAAHRVVAGQNQGNQALLFDFAGQRSRRQRESGKRCVAEIVGRLAGGDASSNGNRPGQNRKGNDDDKPAAIAQPGRRLAQQFTAGKSLGFAIGACLLRLPSPFLLAALRPV